MKPPLITVTKKFSFSMAHALYGYDGACANVHGHTYTLFVTVSGRPHREKGHPNDGMLMDFGDLKRLVHDNFIVEFDHSLVLNENTSPSLAASLKENFEKVILSVWQPTCENLMLHAVERLRDKLPEGLSLHVIRLEETPDSWSEWQNPEK
jgi:6-pyruvoyltetrahydropterin/6-carboxytetrahydropterin synthase